MSDHAVESLPAADFTYLPADACTLLEPGAELSRMLPYDTPESEVRRRIMAYNLYLLGKELFGYGIVTREVSDGEVLQISAYGTKMEPFSCFKVVSRNAVSIFTARPDGTTISLKTTADGLTRTVRPHDVPTNHWSAIGLTKSGIELGKRIGRASPKAGLHKRVRALLALSGQASL